MSKLPAENSFCQYVLDFYGPNGIYPMDATRSQVEIAIKILQERHKEIDFDSVDRERVRDILIEKFGLVFPVNYFMN